MTNCREFWIGLGKFVEPNQTFEFMDAKESKPLDWQNTADGKPWIHVIEYAALQAEQERHVDDVAKLQKELNEARAENEMLKDKLEAQAESALHSYAEGIAHNKEYKEKQITELREALEKVKPFLENHGWKL